MSDKDSMLRQLYLCYVELTMVVLAGAKTMDRDEDTKTVKRLQENQEDFKEAFRWLQENAHV